MHPPAGPGQSVWLTLYRDLKHYWNTYRLSQVLAAKENAFHDWRFRQVITVERVIGFKGDAGGVSYLRKLLDIVLFPEIWKLRSALLEIHEETGLLRMAGMRNPLSFQ